MCCSALFRPWRGREREREGEREREREGEREKEKERGGGSYQNGVSMERHHTSCKQTEPVVLKIYAICRISLQM